MAHFLAPFASRRCSQRNDREIHFDDAAQTKNQRAVADAVEPLGMASPIYAAMVGLDAPTAR